MAAPCVISIYPSMGNCAFPVTTWWAWNSLPASAHTALSRATFSQDPLENHTPPGSRISPM